METLGNRKQNRIESVNLTSYNCLNENNETFHHGMGRTLNVSTDGICLETHTPVDSQYKLSMTIMIDNELVDIDGKVIYCDEGKKGTYQTGIEFMEIGDNALQVLNKLL